MSPQTHDRTLAKWRSSTNTCTANSKIKFASTEQGKRSQRWADAVAPVVASLCLISYFPSLSSTLPFFSYYLLNSSWVGGMRLGKRGTMGWIECHCGSGALGAALLAYCGCREGGLGPGGGGPQVLLGARRWTLIPRRNPQRTEENGSLLCILYGCVCERVLGGGGLIDSLSDWGTVKRGPQSDLPW